MKKFKPAASFQKVGQNYYLLPFRFEKLNDSKDIIVNEVGDFIIVPNGTVGRIIKRELNPAADSELIADLVAKYFISPTAIPELIDILAVRYRTKKSFLEYFTCLHIFVMTLRCNHSCHYCQVSRVSEETGTFDMSIPHIDKAIEYMFRSPNPYITLEFQGGESLLAFRNIKYAVDKTKEINQNFNKHIDFVICSNLAIIDDEILEFCKENNILISTSLDGPDFIHNHNRRNKSNNSHELAIKGIKRCREYLGHDRVSALMTTSPLSLKHPTEIVEEYFNQGFREIFLRAVSPYGYAQRNSIEFNIDNFIEFYKKALNRIIEYNLSGEYYVEIYAKILLEKISTPFQVGFVDLLSPAGLINSVIVFNYDGKVYPSDEARMLAEMQDFTFNLGSLDHDSYKEIYSGKKAREISLCWATEALAGCSDCAFQSYFGADPVRYHAMQNDMYGFRPSSAHCKKNKEIIRYLFELMDNNPDVAKIFKSWLSNK